MKCGAWSNVLKIKNMEDAYGKIERFNTQCGTKKVNIMKNMYTTILTLITQCVSNAMRFERKAGLLLSHEF